MTSSRGWKNSFFCVLIFSVLLPTAVLAAGDMSSTASLSTAIITVGFAGFGLLALYVAYLTGRFILKELKESARLRKEADAKAVAQPKTEGKAALSAVLGLSSLFAVLALGILFIVFLLVISGLDLSSTRAMSALLISIGIGGFTLFLLYIVFLAVAGLFKGKAKPAPDPAEARPLAGLPLNSIVTRRSFLSLLGWAWVVFTTATLGALSTVLRFFFPNVTFEPPLKFKAGYPDTYSLGVDERFKESHRVWIIRNTEGFYSLSTICTHLGCTPNWLQAEQKFKCPCHGSGFYMTGINFEGPAPRPLPRYNMSWADDGQIQLDDGTQYQYELGQWGLPGSFLEYKG